MFALPHHHQQPASFDYRLFSSPSPHAAATPAYHSHLSSSSMYDLERLAYLAARQQQQQEVEEERHHRRRQAELAAYLQAQRQRQQQAAFERAVQEEVERRLQAEKAAALRDALIRRARLAQQQAEEEEARRRQVALVAARRRQAALIALQQEQQRRRRLAVAAEEEQRRRVADARRRQLVSNQAANTFLKMLFGLEEPTQAPEPTKEEVASPPPAAPVEAAPQPAAVEPASAPSPSSSSFPAPVDFSQLEDAATVLQRHFRRHAARRTALSTLERLTSDFESHQSSFTAPSSFTFQSSPAPSPCSSGTSTPPLAYGSANSSFLAYEHYLTTLLSKIDEVQSSGDRVVKKERKELVKRVEAELARLDGMKDEAWEKQSQESQAAGVVKQEHVKEEDGSGEPVEADVAQATPPTSDGPTSAFALDLTTATTGPATNLARAPESAEPASIPSPADEATSPTPGNSPADALSSAPLVAPTPLTPSALASLPDAITLEDDLPATPASPPSRPHSRASTRSASSVASEGLNRYISEMLDRARKLGEEVERMEQEEKEEGEKQQTSAVASGEPVEPSFPAQEVSEEEKEEGVDEEIDVAAILRRRKEQTQVVEETVESPAPADEAPVNDSAEEATSATTDARGDEEKSDAGTEDFEVV